MKTIDNKITPPTKEQLAAFVQQVDSFGSINSAFGEGSNLQTRQQFFQAVPMATTVLYNLSELCTEPACQGEENRDTHTHIAHSVITNKIRPINATAARYLTSIISAQSSLPASKRLPVKDVVPFMETPNFWNRIDTRYYPKQSDALIGVNTAKHYNDFAYTIADKQGLGSVLDSKFEGKKYIAIIYIHPANSDPNGAHASLLIGKVGEDGVVQKDNLISIDGFDSDGYCDMSQVPYKKRIILGGYIEDRAPMLQPPSYNNMNCHLYARNFAKAVMSLEQSVLEDAFTNIKDQSKTKECIKVSINCTATTPVQALAYIMSTHLPYYNSNKSLKSTLEVAEYHAGLRLSIIKRYLDNCLSANIPAAIPAKEKPSITVPALIITGLLIAGIGAGVGVTLTI